MCLDIKIARFEDLMMKRLEDYRIRKRYRKNEVGM
jgi:hypothetical protein